MCYALLQCTCYCASVLVTACMPTKKLVSPNLLIKLVSLAKLDIRAAYLVQSESWYVGSSLLLCLLSGCPTLQPTIFPQHVACSSISVNNDGSFLQSLPGSPVLKASGRPLKSLPPHPALYLASFAVARSLPCLVCCAYTKASRI